MKAIKKDLYSDVRGLIAAARARVAVTVNAELTMLYWTIGTRINEEVLGHRRADYGRRVVEELSASLSAEFGQGWGYRHLMFCVQFASCFPEIEIVNTLCSQLSWSHIKVLLGQDDPLKREFYAEMAKVEHWSVRTLRGRIDSMMYERTAGLPAEIAARKKQYEYYRDKLLSFRRKGVA